MQSSSASSATGLPEGEQLNGLGLELGGVLLSWFAGSHEWILVSFGPEF